MKRYRNGFTLIEALSIIAIISILFTISGYIFSQASRQARDTRRKADLTSISLAFEARYQDKTCTTGAGLYPGQSLQPRPNDWVSVKSLQSYTDGCGPFTAYLRIFPSDPKFESTHPYIFNLPDQAIQPAKHYRLAARLEKKITDSSQEGQDRSRILSIWTGSFAGADLSDTKGKFYTYIIGN